MEKKEKREKKGELEGMLSAYHLPVMSKINMFAEFAVSIVDRIPETAHALKNLQTSSAVSSCRSFVKDFSFDENMLKTVCGMHCEK